LNILNSILFNIIFIRGFFFFRSLNTKKSILIII